MRSPDGHDVLHAHPRTRLPSDFSYVGYEVDVSTEAFASLPEGRTGARLLRVIEFGANSFIEELTTSTYFFPPFKFKAWQYAVGVNQTVLTTKSRETKPLLE